VIDDWPDSCDAAIVGAGVTGLSTAVQIADDGRTKVIVFERSGIAAEASGIQPGGVRQQWSTRVNCLLARESAAFYRDIDQQLDSLVAPVLEPCGYIFLAHTQAQLARLAADVEVQNDAGVPSVILSAYEAAEAVPDLATESVAGASWCQEDGYFDRPQAVVEAFAETARRRNVTIAHADVTRLNPRRSGWELELSNGRRAQAGAVIVATGYDTAALLEPLGIELPIRKEPRYLFLSEPIRERLLEPLVISAERGFAAKQLANGRVLASDLTAVDGEPELWRRAIRAHIEELLPRLQYVSFPVLAEGFYDSTPDNQPIVDQLADGLWVAAGFSGHGFMLAPAISARLAQAIRGSTNDGLLSAFSADRFDSRKLSRESAVV
jgi:sarcosine oxidase, subunit beta